GSASSGSAGGLAEGRGGGLAPRRRRECRGGGGGGRGVTGRRRAGGGSSEGRGRLLWPVRCPRHVSRDRARCGRAESVTAHARGRLAARRGRRRSGRRRAA